MAEVVRQTKKITKTIVVDEVTEGFTINLDPDEALILATVLSRVAGHPEKSGRGVAEKILNDLNKYGVNWASGEYRKLLSGTLIFEDTR